MPPFLSTVIRPPDLTQGRPCPACGLIDCPSTEHRLLDPFADFENDPIVLVVEDCYIERLLGRSTTPSRFLAFAAGTLARRSLAEAAGAVVASLAPPIEVKGPVV